MGRPFINLSHVKKIRVYDFEESYLEWKYEKEVKLFGKVIIKEGVANKWNHIKYSINELPLLLVEGSYLKIDESYIFNLKNNKIYRKPRVVIEYINDEVDCVNWDNYEEAKRYAHELKNKMQSKNISVVEFGKMDGNNNDL